MGLWRIFQAVEMGLRGWPDRALTVAIIAVASLAVLLALFAPATIKAAVLAYIILP